MNLPCFITSSLAATASAGDVVFDMRGIDRASVQINATLTTSDTDVVTLQLSNDGTNYVGFATAKTVTFTGGGTVNALFELGSIDYAYFRVHFAAPSAHTVAATCIVYATATVTQTIN